MISLSKRGHAEWRVLSPSVARAWQRTRQHAQQHAVVIDELVLERRRHMHGNQGGQGVVQRGMHQFEQMRHRRIGGQQIGQLPHTPPHHGHTSRRTQRPAAERYAKHQQIEQLVHQGRGRLLPGRNIAGQRRRAMREPPADAQHHQQQHGDAEPFVPRIQLDFAHRKRKPVHIKPQRKEAKNQQGNQPVQQLRGQGVAGQFGSRRGAHVAPS